jgi:iron complex outermembrane receptor protein
MKRCTCLASAARPCALATIAALVVATAPVPARAETATAGGLEEVTVTARRFAESLQETPVAVSAFSDDALEARAITNLEEIGRYVPNMQFSPNGIAGGSSGQPFIRGVGQFDFMITTDPGVAIYLDGVYLARSLGNLLDLVDVERVEVLRGPQGTLYGKNTIGGAINVVTRRPGDETELFGEVRVGDFDRFDARASVSLPLVADRLAVRLAASTKNADGYGKRLLTGDEMGDEGSNAYQAVVDWQPTDTLDVTLALDRTDVDQAFAVSHVEEINPAAPLQGLYNALVAPYDARYITTDPYESNATGLNSNEQDIWGASLTLTWQRGDLTLKSITGYRDQEQEFGTDPDGSPETIVDEDDSTDQDQFSEELQLSGTSFGDRLRWVGGLYYFEEDAAGLMDVTLLPGIFTALEGLPGPFVPLAPGVTCPPPPEVPLPCAGGAGNPLNTIFDLTRIITLDQQTQSVAVYGQASYQLTEPLSLTVGVRYTREDKDFSTSLYLPTSGQFLIPPTKRSDSWSDVSPRFGVEYRVNDDVLLYASASKGFKSGGFNGRGSNANEVNAYDPEELWSYEAGVKSEWWDRRLRLNAAAFFNDYSDLQFTTQTVAPDGTQVVLVGNAAKAEIKGVEIELSAAPVEALNLSATVGYLDSKYTEIEPSVQTITLDSELIGAPEWTASAAADFTIPLDDWAELVLRSDYTYRAKTYFDAANTESVAQHGYGLWNAAVTLRSPSDRWALTAGVLNLADEEYRVTGVGVLDSLGFASAIYGRPREWFAQASVRF